MLFLTQLTEYGIILPVFSVQQHNSQKLTILRICLSGVVENTLVEKNKLNRKDKVLKTYKTLGIKAVQGSLRSANQKGIRGILKSFYHPNIQSRVAVALISSTQLGPISVVGQYLLIPIYLCIQLHLKTFLRLSHFLKMAIFKIHNFHIHKMKIKNSSFDTSNYKSIFRLMLV